MLAQGLGRDLQIGLRLLAKEKAFCALAVTVLALGIGGVTTMFSVVDGVMLRGFSFPNAPRLMSVNFVDPTSATFFGLNGRVSSMDYQELVPEQKSFERLAAYLNGSTVNLTVDGQPRRRQRAGIVQRAGFIRDLAFSGDGQRLAVVTREEEAWLVVDVRTPGSSAGPRRRPARPHFPASSCTQRSPPQ